MKNIIMINKAYECLTETAELARYKAASRDNNLADFF
tara:strand:+ start:1302 stop:1412 length:111 start_codon:yes stop_codon:yes gene_type:complete